jgi:putative endonuclease
MNGTPTNAFTLAQAARRRRRKRPAGQRQRPRQQGSEIVLSPTQKRGRHWEDKAADFLAQQGLALLARNLNCKAGEIDLVALERDGTLVFIEVRQRRSPRFGRAGDTVNYAKQQRLIRAACWLLPGIRARFLAGRSPVCRFDIIGFDNGELTWLKAAFQA